MTYFLPWKCGHERHTYEECQYLECVGVARPPRAGPAIYARAAALRGGTRGAPDTPRQVQEAHEGLARSLKRRGRTPRLPRRAFGR